MNVGDSFTLTPPVKRKWWHFWKPRVSNVTRAYRVADDVKWSGPIHSINGELCANMTPSEMYAKLRAANGLEP